MKYDAEGYNYINLNIRYVLNTGVHISGIMMLAVHATRMSGGDEIHTHKMLVGRRKRRRDLEEHARRLEGTVERKMGSCGLDSAGLGYILR